MNNRLLVIGANSFVASAFARACAVNGYQLHGIYNSRTHLIERELYQELRTTLDEPPKSDFDAVIFFSSFIPHGRMDERNWKLNQVNEFLIQCANRYRGLRFVYCSSVSVYGTPLSLPITEASPFNCPSAYGLAKLAGESIVDNCDRGISIRIGSTYGTGMRNDLLVDKWCRGAKYDGNITVFGDGSRRQDYVHVDDVASCILAAVASKCRGPALCVSGHSISNLELANLIQRNVTGCNIKFDGKDESPSFAFDHSRTMQQLGWKPRVEIDAGLKELIDRL